MLVYSMKKIDGGVPDDGSNVMTDNVNAVFC
jgi:hypothetical protein